MPRRELEELRRALLQNGVLPFYAQRTVRELDEHWDDLERDALAAGLSSEEAHRRARAMLGSTATIAAAVLARRELLVWNRRWPRLASCMRSAAAVGSLPTVPLSYCVEHRPEIARWSTAVGGATMFVAAIWAWLDWLFVLS